MTLQSTESLEQLEAMPQPFAGERPRPAPIKGPWSGKVVVVTGGSSGLGRSLTEVFGRKGAKIAICARQPDKLRQAAEEMRSSGIDVLALQADVTDQEQVETLFQNVVAHFGRIDCLVNNAGRSMRRQIMATTPEDFQALWELNFLSVVRCTRAAMPHLLASKGHLVNIGSLAGKAASRYVGAYPATKFALTAYTQQIRLELGDQGLNVLLVCPGPISREEPRVVSETDLHGLPESAKKPGAGVKAKLIDRDWLAGRIVRACEKRQQELVFPRLARWFFALMQLSPRLADLIVRYWT